MSKLIRLRYNFNDPYDIANAKEIIKRMEVLGYTASLNDICFLDIMELADYQTEVKSLDDMDADEFISTLKRWMTEEGAT